MNADEETLKQVYVGSLLSYSQNLMKFKLAVWYRVLQNEKKLIQIKNIKNEDQLLYKCTVFDVGSTIQLILQKDRKNKNKIIFGLVKFQPFLTKQIDQIKNKRYFFHVKLHAKGYGKILCKIRTVSMHDDNFQFQIEIKRQLISLTLPSRQKWRSYEQIFIIQSSKQADFFLAKNVCSEQNLSQLKNHGVDLDFKKYIHFSFPNQLERNLFLTQMLKKISDKSQLLKRPSETHSAASSSKNYFQNQINDLFKQQNPMARSLLPQYIYKDFQEVVFTPHLYIQGEQLDRQKYMSNFQQFLNQQQFNRVSAAQLPKIEQEQIDQINDVPYFYKITEVQSKKSIEIPSKLHIQDFQQNNPEEREAMGNKGNQYFKHIVVQNKQLKKQNQELKQQNLLLQKQLQGKEKYKEQEIKFLRYSAPYFIRIRSKQKRRAGSYNQEDVSYNYQSAITKDQFLHYRSRKQEQQSKQTINCKKKAVANLRRNEYELQMKKKYEKVSMSGKLLRKFVNIE